MKVYPSKLGLRVKSNLVGVLESVSFEIHDSGIGMSEKD